MTASLTVVAVGDLQLGDSPTTVGYGFYSRYRGKSLDPLFADVKAGLSGADIVFGNLEATLLPPPKGASGRRVVQLRGEPAFARDLSRAGFTVLNVANNHAVQHGDESFHSTVAAVRSAGIACCGVRGTPPWATEPVRLSSRGTDVGVLGYCLRPRQYGSAVPPYAEGTLEEICADVARLKETVASVIVSLHWGEEFVSQPSRTEMGHGRAIIDAGASLLLGHHPHVSRPVEKHRSGLIAYSLGNFMGDMTWYAPFRRGILLRCTLLDRAVTDASVTETRLENDYRPVLTIGQPILSEDVLTGLEQHVYEKAIRDTWRSQRLHAYAAAVLNLPKTPPRVFAQLATDTIRNKMAALLSGLSRQKNEAP